MESSLSLELKGIQGFFLAKDTEETMYAILGKNP